MLEEVEEKKKLLEKLDSLSKVRFIFWNHWVLRNIISPLLIAVQGQPVAEQLDEEAKKQLETELAELKLQNQDLIDQVNRKESQYNEVADECESLCVLLQTRNVIPFFFFSFFAFVLT